MLLLRRTGLRWALPTQGSLSLLEAEPRRSVWGPEHQPNPRGHHRPNKHRDLKDRKARAAKVLKVELPDYDFQRRIERDDLTPSEMREYLKRSGMLPPTPYSEKAVYLSSTGAVLDEFVPPEGDGRASILSKEGAKQNVAGVTKRGKSYLALRRIRRYDEDFDPTNFVQEAQEIYIKAHQALADKDEDELHKLATEKLFPEMTFNTDNKTIRWNFIKSLEPPRVVQIRTQNILMESNMFAQITVRFNTQQTLAVYDRFGRLIHGSKTVAKDVLEYVVFEKHLANVYGSWRLHAKIIPDWMEAKPAGLLTHVCTDPKVADDAKVADEVQNRTTTAREEKEEDDKEEDFVYDRFGRRVQKNSSET